jgi:hypothetical protein
LGRVAAVIVFFSHLIIPIMMSTEAGLFRAGFKPVLIDVGKDGIFG